MSQPIPEAEHKPTVFAVPEHISSVLIAGGCGLYHSAVEGAVACERCALVAIGHIFPPAPQASAAEPAAPAPASEAPSDLISVPDSTAPLKVRPKTQPTE